MPILTILSWAEISSGFDSAWPRGDVGGALPGLLACRSSGDGILGHKVRSGFL
jgi:hypothetical protein